MKKFIRNVINKYKYMKRKNIYISHGCNLNKTFLQGNNRIGYDTFLITSKIGKGSYIGDSCHLSHVSIGKYCSLGRKINVIVGNHPSKTWVTTHPAFFSLRRQAGFTYVDEPCFEESTYSSASPDYYVTIGNDVWIGDNVNIMSGVDIGDGAIIGACALVTQDVPPYTIVGGVPAKPIRQRFSGQEIDLLVKFKWWDKDEEWLKANVKAFSDIKQFTELVNSEWNDK